MNPSLLWYPTERHIPVVGHRGVSAHCPENTLPSFEAAIRLGVDLIEFDVNVSKDGELMVIHDTTVDRTSDRTGRVRDYTLAELKSFDFSYTFPEYRGVQIPTLREVLRLVSDSSDKLLLNVEIKDMEHGTVDRTVRMLKEFDLADRSVIASFDAEILRYTHAAHPEMRCQGFSGRYMEHFEAETYACMLGMGIPLHGKNRTDAEIRAEIDFAKERGILAWLFTADTPEDVRRCVSFGCDNVTGNDPAVALNTLRDMGMHSPVNVRAK